jgi:hypothetical protein
MIYAYFHPNVSISDVDLYAYITLITLSDRMPLVMSIYIFLNLSIP